MTGVLLAINFETSGEVDDDTRVLIHKKILQIYVVTGSLVVSHLLNGHVFYVRIWLSDVHRLALNEGIEY